ncbi:S-layer homology domain-containing protein [Paenibacillus chungangensis]|uniref:S-layer homology domain-containing protein n=1 Tax=Paenibacillus chungangensis TaxID=696535 RepID=A0ABW3HRI3_9BACL
MKLRLPILFIAAMLLLLPSVAGADSQHVTLDPVPNKQRGDTVEISGSTSYDEVIIKVIQPDQTVLLFEMADAREGKFHIAFTLPTDATAGPYNIAAGKGTDVANASFQVIVHPAPVIPPVGNAPEQSQAGQCTVSDDRIINADRLKQALEKCKSTHLVIELSDEAMLDDIILPWHALASKQLDQPDGIITIKTPGFSVDLPIALASFVGAGDAVPSDASIVFQRKPVDQAMLEEIDRKADEEGLTLISPVVPFGIYIDTMGERSELNHFGDTYMTRTFVVDHALDASLATVFMYNPATGTFAFVPALFTVENGRTTIAMQHNANGVYVVVSSRKSFGDLNGHWGRQAIEWLASKGIVSGVSQTQFNPDGEITRAEFAALLVRSLGLQEEIKQTTFADVGSNEWYTGVIGAAVSSGLINGYKDGTFRPDASISREQMATMITRALAFAGQPAPSADPHSLSQFKDGSEISSWAASSVAGALQIGLVTGMGDGSFDPAGEASRAQAATMLLRMLRFAEFMN